MASVRWCLDKKKSAGVGRKKGCCIKRMAEKAIKLQSSAAPRNITACDPADFEQYSQTV